MELLLAHRLCIILYLVVIFDVLYCYKVKNTTGNKAFRKNIPINDDEFLEELLFPENNFKCDKVVNITDKYGFIKSPNYPRGFKVPISCQWNIVGTQADEVITISFVDLDIENTDEYSAKCQRSHNPKICCGSNFLRINSLANERLYCGGVKHKESVYVSDSNFVSITFNATTNRNNHGGFYFSYAIAPKFSSQCASNEYLCDNGRCIANQWVCNDKNECLDWSDEKRCAGTRTTLFKCGDSNEFHEHSKKCDFKVDCANKFDELGCLNCAKDKFSCLSTKECIDSELLCNGFADCPDFSDELNCAANPCPANQIRCGPLASCYDPYIQRCNKVLDCPNGVDEWNCIENCHGRISCSFEKGCYDLDERCNGLVQCADFSDEVNCTSEVCRADRGNLLCGGNEGRCIPPIMKCDRVEDCRDGSDEEKCLIFFRNDSITLSIIVFIIFSLLTMITISCIRKWAALRYIEFYRSSLTNSAYQPGPFPNAHLPFPVSTGDLDASLFRLDHSVFLREPPPSYASTMGGYLDPSGPNNSYMEQYRRYRRQRRCRRMLRRQHRQQNGVQSPAHCADMLNQVNAEPLNLAAAHHTDTNLMQTGSNSIAATHQDPQSIAQTLLNMENTMKRSGSSGNTNNRSRQDLSGQQLAQTNCSSVQATSANPDSSSAHQNLNIELEPIPPLMTNFDCDSQPLIR